MNEPRSRSIELPCRRTKHVVAILAYVVGYYGLVEWLTGVGAFSFLMPELYSWFSQPGELIRACRRSVQCEAAMAACHFGALGIVTLGVRRLFEGKLFRAPAQRRSPELWGLVFIGAFAAVPIVGAFLSHSEDRWFTRSERWRYLTGIVVVEYLADAVAAWMGTRHAMQLGERREEETEGDAEG